MKKLLAILGLTSILTLSGGSAAGYVFASAEETQPQTWDAVETFDSVASVDEKFDFYFCSSQNARRSDEFSYSWELQDGAVRRTGNVDPASDTVNIAIMTYISEVYDDFELSVDFKAGSLTQYWPVIGIRQQIPGKNYTVEGGGTGVFMQQDGKITFWGPITSGIIEEFIPNTDAYYPLMWHTMVIRAEGSNVKVFVDDAEVADITVNATDYTKGYISLISVNNDCSFDNFKVRALGGASQKGNEENRYEHADLGQGLDDIIQNGYTGVQLPDDNYSTELGAPTVRPISQQVNVDKDFSDVTYAIGYNNGEFQSLKHNGLTVNESNYTRKAAKLIFTKEYVATLPVGDNVFTLTTNGGTVEFTLTVIREKVVFTDTTRVKKFSVADVSFKMDFGGGSLEKVTLGGAILPESAYTYQNGALRIKREFLSTLETGVYEVFVYDQNGNCVDCFVTIGIESKDVFVINYDSLTTPENGYGQDLTVSSREGLYGNGGGITSNGAGTMFIFDGENIAYNFVSGQTYSVTTYLKFNNTVAGTSNVLDLLMPIYFKTAAGNADIGYLRYNAENGYYFQQEVNGLSSSLTKLGEWYRLSFTFTYNSAWTRMEMPVWMVTDFTMDNFVLAPYTAANVPSILEEIAIPKNTEEDVVLNCSAGVIGINYNGEALTDSAYAYANGKITLKKAFLSALTAGEHTVTVYCTNSYHSILLKVNKYAFSVTGNTEYTGTGDLTLTVQTDTFSLSNATISDARKTLTANVDYVVNGNQLVLKEAYLQTLVASENVTITFAADAKVECTITTNKLLFVDFENGSMATGFAYGMTQETTTGKTGNGVRLTNTAGATLLALGGAFYDMEFEAQKTYTFSFDLKIEEIATETNFIIPGNNCWIPITFGSGKDVVYLRVVKTGDGYVLSGETQQVGISASVGTMDANGFRTVTFTFIPQAGCTTLTFDVWMASTIVVDNLSLTVQ